VFQERQNSMAWEKDSEFKTQHKKMQGGRGPRVLLLKTHRKTEEEFAEEKNCRSMRRGKRNVLEVPSLGC